MASITKRDIVNRSFELLGMSGFDLDDAPEDEQSILQTLDDMMAELQGVDYNFGYLVADDVVDSYLGDLAGIERDALSGISHKLALRICPLFGKQPNPLLIMQTDDAYNALLTRYQVIPETVPHVQNYHYGAGNKRYW